VAFSIPASRTLFSAGSHALSHSLAHCLALLPGKLAISIRIELLDEFLRELPAGALFTVLSRMPEPFPGPFWALSLFLCFGSCRHRNNQQRRKQSSK